MFVWRPQPVYNLPQALLELKAQLEDPKTLGALVQAAKEVTQANALTEEEVEALADAMATIDRAGKLDAEMKKREADVKELIAKASAESARAAAREKLCDERNTTLAEKEKALEETHSAKIKDLTLKSQAAVDARAKADAEAKLHQDKSEALDKLQAKLAKEKAKWDTISKLAVNSEG